MAQPMDRYERLAELSPLNAASGALLYSARDTVDSQAPVVAVKQINKAALVEASPLRAAKILERLRNEREAAWACRGTRGVCELKDVVETASHVFLVMELCLGQDLFDVVRAAPGGHLTEAAAASLFAQLVEAVQGVHEAGYIHRDIKPENILCVPDASGQLRLKIVDFGAAKPLEHDLCASVSGTTVWNASPERGYGEAESTSADVWALGSVLYFMLTGNSPFHNLYEGSADDGVVIDRVLEEDLEWPASPAVSPTGRLTVEWLLSKEADDRPTLDELLEGEWLTQHQSVAS